MVTTRVLLLLAAVLGYAVAATTCPPNSGPSPPGVYSACSCNSGYFSAGTTPEGQLRGCLPVCPDNQYPNVDSTGLSTGGCSNCPAGSTSVSGSRSCKCSNGAGSSNNAAGQTSVCYCPSNAVRSATTGLCACNSFYPVVGSTFPDGTVKTCLPKCAANKYPQTRSDGSPTGACLSCPANSFSAAGSLSCTCSPGFYSASTNPAGTLSCYPICSANQAPNLNSDSSPAGGCSLCPPRSTSSGTDKSCTCDPNTTSGPTNAAGQTTSCGPCASPYVDSTDGTGCVLPASPGSHSRAKKRAETVFSLCPAGLDACSINGSRSHGYECLSLQDELEHCGACNNSCLEIPGVEGVTCAEGSCRVHSCQDGYNFVDILSGSCVPETAQRQKDKSKRRAAARRLSHESS